MIVFTCRACGRPLEASDQHAGNEVGCPVCGTFVPVPIDLACDGDAAPADVATVPLAEFLALRKDRA